MPLVRNLTPFELVISAERYGAPVYEAAAFATVSVPERYSTPVRRRRDAGAAATAPTQVAIDRLHVQRRGGDLEWPIGMVSISDQEAPLSITVDQLRTNSDPSRGFTRTRTFENDTSEWVDIAIAGGDASTLATLGPGDCYINDTPHAQVWVVRSAFSNEVVSAFIDDDDPAHREISYQITDDYRQRLAEHAPLPSPLPGNRPVVLISGKRETRPPEDRIFITTEDRDGPVRPEFNGRTDVVPRRVKVAAAKLIWSATDDNYGLMSLQGKDVLDLESLEMVADEVVIRSELRFPGTNVSITARRIEFADKGMINTSPPAVAEREFTGPKEKPPKAYIAQSGAAGLPGGSVTLIARTLITGDPGKTRICTRGGKGGKGERGGLLAYRQRPTHEPYTKSTKAPEESADCGTILQPDIVRSFHGWWATTAGNVDGWRWPGREEDPYHCRYDGRPLFWIGGSSVTSLLITAHDDGLIISESDWLEFSPTEAKKCPTIVARSDTKRFTEHRDPSLVRRVPGDGADAYSGGRPGDGGAAGVVSTTPELAAVVARISDIRGGEAGPTTASVEGAPPGTPEVALLVDMAIVRKGNSREPQMWVEEYRAKPGQSWPALTANPGRDGGVQSVGGNWLRVEAVDAVLSFARAAFRDGHREAARQAIEPYHALFRSPVQQQRNPQFGSQIIALSTMRANLLANLDYYGNPPGWLPRLRVKSNLGLFNTIRKASYQLLYFATTTEGKFDDVSHRRTLAQEVRTALESETTACQKAVAGATTMMEEARKELSVIANQLGGQQQVLDKLKNYAEAEALSAAEKQRIFKGVMQVVGGTMQALPVGQPYLGTGGDLVSAVGEIDFFTSDKPADRAAAVLTKIGEATDSFLDNNGDLLAQDLVGDQRRQAKAGRKGITKLADLIKDANGEARQIEENETELTKDVENQRVKDLQARREITRDKIEAVIKELGTDDKPEDVVNDLDQIDESGRRKPAASPKTNQDGPKTKKQGPKTQKAVSLQRELHNLEDSLREVEEDIKDAETLDAKRKAQRLVRLKLTQNALIDAKHRVQNLEKLKEKTEAKIDEAEEQADTKQEQYTKAMGRLTSIGKGIGGIGAGISTLATPVSKDDTVVQELAADLLKTKDPQQYQRVIKEMEGLGKRKNVAIANLLKAQSIISANVARMAESLTAQNDLGRQLHNMDNSLDLRAKQYLRGMRQRAEEMFHSSMYHLVMSYRYEALEDLPDSLVNYDRIVAALQQLDRVGPVEQPNRRTDKPKAIGKPRRTARHDEDDEDDEDEPADLMEAVQGLSIDITEPSEDDLADLDKFVLKFELSKLGVEIATKRQHQAIDKEVNTATVQLKKEQLEQLSQLGTTTFNLINDFGVGRYTWADARIVDIALKKVQFDSPDPTVNLRVDFWHSGESIINIPTSTRAPVYYYFRAAPTDDPVTWGFGATSTKEASPKSSSRRSSATSDDGDAATVKIKRDTRVEIEKTLAEALNLADVEFEEYWPSLFSDITLKADPGGVTRVDAITYLEFEVTFAKRPTESYN